MEPDVRVDDVVREFITSELLPDRTVGRDDNLLADGAIDSMGVVRLVAFIGERFGYAVPFDDVTVENFGTLGRLTDYLDARVDGTR